MTRRERHLRIIESWGDLRTSKSVRFEFDGLLAKLGMSALTDAAVRELATRLVRARSHQNRMNAENRKRRT